MKELITILEVCSNEVYEVEFDMKNIFESCCLLDILGNEIYALNLLANCVGE